MLPMGVRFAATITIDSAIVFSIDCGLFRLLPAFGFIVHADSPNNSRPISILRISLVPCGCGLGRALRLTR
jgi:hypothetical protein